MPPLEARRIARARELLAEIHHVAVATVNDDGSPHNSPVYMAFDRALHGYWASHPASLHSRNIARDGKVFLAIFDSRQGHGGLFIEAEADVLSDKAEVAAALATLTLLKERLHGAMGGPEAYADDAPQRLYRAVPRRLWVNQSEKNVDGVVVRDRRYEITITDLI